MNRKLKSYGVTLIELLIVLAVIVVIVTMVYSTYFATSRSVQKCREKLTHTQQARALLDKMSRQLRSLYLPAFESMVSTLPEDIIKKEELPAETPVGLTAAADDREGIILQMLTSANLFYEKDMPCGIWNVKYKYLPEQKMLFYSQRPWVSRPENERSEENWLPLAKNLRSIQLQFYDGERWRPKWNSGKYHLPEAVRIDISLGGEHIQSPKFSTITDIASRRNTLEKIIRHQG